MKTQATASSKNNWHWKQ